MHPRTGYISADLSKGAPESIDAKVWTVRQMLPCTLDRDHVAANEPHAVKLKTGEFRAIPLDAEDRNNIR